MTARAIYSATIALAACGAGATPGEVEVAGASSTVDVAARSDSGAAGEVSPDLAVADADEATKTCPSPCSAWTTCVGDGCVAKPCTSDADCNATPPVPADAPHFCYKGKCAAFQCGVDADCPKGQTCNPFTFLCVDPPKGCTTAKQCDDADPCTTDACQPGGSCQHKPIPGCCDTISDCDDGKPCTIDTCTGGLCVWSSAGKCCSSAKECDDANLCTQDSCQSGVCKHTTAKGCCKSATECDDFDPSSVDGCAAGTCTHVWPGLAATCGGGPCSQNACAKGSCVAGQCTYAPTPGPACCTADAQCLLDGKCQIAQCSALTCSLAPVKGQQGPHLRYRFDAAALNGWTVEKSSASVYFHFGTVAQVSGAGALRYGAPGKITFEDSTANKGAAVSPPFAAPAGAPALRFWTLLDVSPGAAIHQCGIDVHDAATGAKLAALWSKNAQLASGTTGAKWVQQVVVLPPSTAGKTVKLRAWFDQVKYDTSNKDKLGWVLDEIEVLGACP